MVCLSRDSLDKLGNVHLSFKKRFRLAKHAYKKLAQRQGDKDRQPLLFKGLNLHELNSILCKNKALFFLQFFAIKLHFLCAIKFYFQKLHQDPRLSVEWSIYFSGHIKVYSNHLESFALNDKK